MKPQTATKGPPIKIKVKNAIFQNPEDSNTCLTPIKDEQGHYNCVKEIDIKHL